MSFDQSTYRRNNRAVITAVEAKCIEKIRETRLVMWGFGIKKRRT